MKQTVEALKETLPSIIGEMGKHPEKYTKNPKKDFIRCTSLTLPTLISLILIFYGDRDIAGIVQDRTNETDS